MNPDDLNFYYNRFKFGEDNFHNLMSFRVRKILLVATFYDAYTIEHDGRLTEQITGDYFRLNLTTIPRITSLPTGEEALARLQEERFDLVITTLRTGTPDPFDLSRKIHEYAPDIPVLLLLTVKSDMELVRQNARRMDHIENVFLWNGDSRLFIAMIKSVEDRRNAPYDTEHGLVRVILLVEDSVDFYSLYLPIVYQEIMEQTQRLISEELNENQKYHLMRTRPKVLLVKTYEDALALSRRYSPYLLSVISDIRFLRNGIMDPEAGVLLIRQLRRDFADVPMLLQSSDEEARRHALALGVDFIHKHSVSLMAELRQFIVGKLGFGEFIFRDPGGREVGRASSLGEMEEAIHRMPIESILHHASRNHFSAWLVAHGEFQVARRLRPVRVGDFETSEEHRLFLVRAFQEARVGRLRGKIVEFDRSAVLSDETVLRLRDGSLGGKGRGLAFCNALLVSTEQSRSIEGAEIRIPRTMIIATDEYDQFLQENRIPQKIGQLGDREIQALILSCPLSEYTEKRLEEYLEICHSPLAVRSSSLLEDSHAQPFAGVYGTFMIPNCHPNREIRKRELLRAVKMVYVSVFLEETRRFIRSHGYRLDEEKMGIVIQELAGRTCSNRFYPHISGVAQSYNFYPPQGLTHRDPVASLAVGLGQTVVGGGKTYRYCPSRPGIPCHTPDEVIRFTQTEFFALDLDKTDILADEGGWREPVISFPVSTAESDGMLDHLASVLYHGHLEEGLYNEGPRILNFPDIIRYDFFPLSRILDRMLSLFEKALGCPAEIEFAVDLVGRDHPVFYLLQVRPMTATLAYEGISRGDFNPESSLIYTENSLGHGIPDDLYDLVYLPPRLFDRTRTEAMRDELRDLNRVLKEEGRRYILMAPGRWGSADRFLGIPVSWPQIDQAGIIVEAAVKGMMVEPSQGSHFFHNLTAGGVGYLMVKEGAGSSSIDWEALDRLPEYGMGRFFRHIRLDSPFRVLMEGKSGRAVISEPETVGN